MKIVLRSGLVAAAVVIAVALFAGWLFNTVGGRDLLLARIVARLPSDAHLRWKRAEGPAAGPMTLHGLHFDYHGTVFDADTVMLDPSLRPLARGRLRLDVLSIAHGVLRIPDTGEPFKLPEWPGSLPAIATPLPIRVDALRVDDLRIDYGNMPVMHLDAMRGDLLAEPGLLRVHGLAASGDRGRFTLRGDYVPREDFRSNLTASAWLAASPQGTRASLGLVLRGDLSHMELALAGNAPGPLHATVSLRGRGAPHWTAALAAEGIDGAVFGLPMAAAAPWTANFEASGVGGLAGMQGALRSGDTRYAVLPSSIRIARQQLSFQPLVLGLAGGTARVSGMADFADPKAIRLDVGVVARDLHWGGPAPAQSIVAGGDIRLTGTSKAWVSLGSAKLSRAGQSATLTLELRGDQAHADVRSLHAAMPTGSLEADGRVAWSPALSWSLDTRLAGFDPGYFFAGWNGAIHGNAHTAGSRRDDGGLEASLDAPALAGMLRGRALKANASLRMHGAPDAAGTRQGDDAYEGKLDLALGASHVAASGRIAEAVDVSATLSPLQLQDLAPGGRGLLRGTLHVRGPRRAPDIDAALDGQDLAWGTQRAAHLSAHGRLPWHAGKDGQLHLEASGLQVGLPFDALVLDARGAVEKLALSARAHGELGSLEFAGTASRLGAGALDAGWLAAGWRGSLDALRLEPTRGAPWQLQQPASFAWRGARGTLARACLASDAGGTLCAGGEWPGRGIVVHGSALPLSLVQAYLPNAGLPECRDGQERCRPGNPGARPWQVHGTADLDATIVPGARRGWRGEARVAAHAGGLSLGGRSDVVSYQSVLLTMHFDANTIGGDASATFTRGGTAQASLATGWTPASTLVGSVELHTSEIGWLELFSPDIAAPTGRVDGRLVLGGTRGQPRVGGQATLANFAADLPALGVSLREGSLRLDARADGSAALAGQVRAGDGVLHLDGRLGWAAGVEPLRLHITGSHLLVSDTRALRAVIDPDVVVTHKAGEGLVVSGTVALPSARLHLDVLDGGVASSPDVHVVDPVPEEGSAPLALELDLTLVPGKDVRVDGFGLDGALSGRLRARSRPGSDLVATGQLDLDGTYVVYGQKLKITRGRLAWSGSPVGNPLVDIRAERQVGDVTAGVDVRGRAQAPTATVWTDPASSQSEALAYLALGRPLSSASGSEGRQLNAARSALSLGSNLLVGQLGARLGLEDAGIADNRALGGDVVSAGKYLSPRLYVSYGVALLGTGQVLTLKYLLRKGFDIEVESSTAENKASINVRRER
jgi:translocation and assembly module TamB